MKKLQELFKETKPWTVFQALEDAAEHFGNEFTRSEVEETFINN